MRDWYMRWRETEGARWFGFLVVLAIPTIMAMLP